MARVPNDGAIAERARRSLGLLTIRQLDAMGVTRQRRRTLVARGTLVPLGRSVFRHCAWSASWEQLVLAAILAAGPGAVASHRSAAALWRFEGMGRGPAEITVPIGRHPEPDHATVHRSRDLVVADIEPRTRIPMTTAARTLLDIAPLVEEPRLEAALDHAERRGIIWRPHLRWRLEELARQGRPGVPAVRRLLDRTEGRALGDTWLEQEALRLIAHAGLPVPRCQVHLRKVGGGIARVDLFWDAVRLVVELDGHGTHATRRDRQTGAERAARLGLDGWRVVPFTYEDVTERPDHVVAMIRAYHRRAGDSGHDDSDAHVRLGIRSAAVTRLRIDAETCTGHGRCYALAPELFEPDDDGHGVVLNGGDVAPGQEDAARRAANNCPERAITVEE